MREFEGFLEIFLWGVEGGFSPAWGVDYLLKGICRFQMGIARIKICYFLGKKCYSDLDHHSCILHEE